MGERDDTSQVTMHIQNWTVSVRGSNDFVGIQNLPAADLDYKYSDGWGMSDITWSLPCLHQTTWYHYWQALHKIEVKEVLTPKNLQKFCRKCIRIWIPSAQHKYSVALFAASTGSDFSLSCILTHRTVKLKLRKEILSEIQVRPLLTLNGYEPNT